MKITAVEGSWPDWYPEEVKDYKVHYYYQLQVAYPRMLIYTILTVALAAFATFLALRRRKGSQPATFGHIPTLGNLIDDWRTDENWRMWWGDKSPPLSEDTGYLSPSSYLARHAGTSPDKSMVRPIHLEPQYA